MRFRKKPVTVEALRVDELNIEAVAEWCGGSVRGVMLPKDQWVIEIETLEGSMRADVGDWVICGIAGEFYPCKPDIFAKTYELVGP